MDEILDFFTKETDSEEEKLIENDSEIDSEWEYEDEEDHVTFVSDENVDFYSNEGDPAVVVAVGPAAGDDSLPPSDRTDGGKPLKTVYICPDCPSNPGLHPESCFKLYHTRLNYELVDGDEDVPEPEE